MRVLLLTPPMTQLNTPYPATAYLKGFLQQKGGHKDVFQADLSLELALRIFSRKGLQAVASELRQSLEKGLILSRSVRFFLENEDRYLTVIEPVIRFLQGKDPSLALRIIGRNFLPEGSRFTEAENSFAAVDSDPLGWAFGTLGAADRAKYLCSLFMDDLADVLQQGIDPGFGLTRNGEKLAASVPTFDLLAERLEKTPHIIDRFLDELTQEVLERFRPDVVGVTAPFPGNVYGAFRIAREVKRLSPQIQLLFGGGYANTELRQLSDVRVFDYFDFVTLDDGERPWLCVLDYLTKQKADRAYQTDLWLRTFVREEGRVVFKTSSKIHDIPHRDTGTPTYQDLFLDRYLSIFEMLNPMHRIWSDGRWNKLTLAHGCYWKKCNFCDVSLDYIGRYDPASADLLVDRIEALVRETGQTGFHFVDEAAPPAALRAVAEKLIERKLSITWWGNIRFEKAFTAELSELLARSGCIAMSGGLEVASDRLLKLMNKGVTVEQVARVTRNLTEAGIMVHAYLMYGFPTQTEQETVDSLERVRQLFSEGCFQSAYWHRFSATVHSPIGQNPEKFGIRILPTQGPVTFAQNDLAFEDPTQCDHDQLGQGLRKALYNYMHGIGLDEDVRFWFGTRKKGRNKVEYNVPAATVPVDMIARALQNPDFSAERAAAARRRGSR